MVITKPAGSLPLPPEMALTSAWISTADLPRGFFTAHGGLWQNVLASLVLSPQERGLWRGLKTPAPRRLEWLLGRVAAKDAVRHHLRERYGLSLCPADVEILPDELGRPVAHGRWAEQAGRSAYPRGAYPVDAVPGLSLAHASGTAVAVATGGGARVGVDIEPVGSMNLDVQSVAFSALEQELLARLASTTDGAWPLRFWCAKEAVSKAVGLGMIEGPGGLVVQDLDASTGEAQVSLHGEIAHRAAVKEGTTMTAFTAHDGEYVLALSVGHPPEVPALQRTAVVPVSRPAGHPSASQDQD
jgi:phosphopantetheine--protein transferase-like protein